MIIKRELWTCPKCGGQFFQKNLWHSCTKYTEEEFLQGKSERAIELYRYFLKEYKKIGTIKLHVIKSRIAFMVLVRFSGVNKLGKDFIEGAFWLKYLVPIAIGTARCLRRVTQPPHIAGPLAFRPASRQLGQFTHSVTIP